MEIFGREYGFLFSVGAEQELAALCPGGDLRQLPKLLQDGGQATVALTEDLLCILSRWHEKARAFQEPGYAPQPLTRELLDLLPLDEFRAVQSEALRSFQRDSKPSVEAEPPKKKEAQR